MRHGLARAVSKHGVCSRAVAASLIKAGRVRLDGAIVRDPATPTGIDSRIEIDGEEVGDARRIYVMLNKPRGLVTTAEDERGRATVYDCFKDSGLPWMAPVGRLDRASEGLLLFTNDTKWSADLLAPQYHVVRTYHVRIAGTPSPTTLARLKSGVVAEGELLRVKHVEIQRQGERNTWLRCELTEGRNRHLRRMFDAVGHPVLRLVRVAIGDLVLGDLAKGAWRHLSGEEVRFLASQS